MTAATSGQHRDLEETIRGVRVVRWNPQRAQHPISNFGDLLGPIIVDAMSAGLRGRASAQQRLLGLGSVLHFAEDNDVVWGTGINGKIEFDSDDLLRKHLDVRAVRGPLTLNVLRRAGIDAPRVFGDPALLLPRLRPDLFAVPEGERFRTVDIPNFNDPLPEIGRDELYIDPRHSVADVIRAIARSEMVIASSLHAIIVAESIGIPARAYRSAVESTFKYHDYYLGTGRQGVQIAQSRDEAVAMGGAPAPDVDLDALSEAFPRDLWGAAASPARPIGVPTAAELALGYLGADARSRENGLIVSGLDELRRALLQPFASATIDIADRSLVARAILQFVDDHPGSAAGFDPTEVAALVAAVDEQLPSADTARPLELGS